MPINYGSLDVSTSGSIIANSGNFQLVNIISSGIFNNVYASGSVGIGTASAQAGFKLDIYGSSVTRGNVLSNGDVSEFDNSRYKLSSGAASNSYSYVSNGSGARFGVGFIAPSGKLSVNGGASIGANYNLVPPTNGLIVEGNVGIGISAPSGIFHINGGIGSDYSQISLTTGGVNTTTHIGVGNSDTRPFLASLGGNLSSSIYGWGFFDRGTDGNFQIQRKGGTTSWNSVLTIQRSNGFFGIGTGVQATTPPEMLTVDGNIRLADKASIGNKLQFYRGGGTANDYTIGTQGNHLAISTASDSTTNRYTEFGYHNGSTWTPKTRINNYTGAMGINNTSTPSGSLDVVGDVFVRNSANTLANIYLKSQSAAFETSCRIRTDTLGNLYLDANSASIKVGNQSADVVLSAGNAAITIGNSFAGTLANQNIRFSPANTEEMRITPSGVGIGTTAPVHELHVAGNILCNQLYLEKTSAPTISSNTLTINLSNSQLFLVSLNSNITTLTISNTPATSNITIGFTIIFTADGTARSVTWPASIKWPGNSAPAITSTNGKLDVFSFVSTDNGTTWLGFVGGQNY
jgi:hypothetical protein